MDDQTLRKIVREEVDASVAAAEQRQTEAFDKRLREEIGGSEGRLAENGRIMFRHLTDIYRSTTLEKIEHQEKHLSDQIAQTRGSRARSQVLTECSGNLVPEETRIVVHAGGKLKVIATVDPSR